MWYNINCIMCKFFRVCYNVLLTIYFYEDFNMPEITKADELIWLENYKKDIKQMQKNYAKFISLYSNFSTEQLKRIASLTKKAKKMTDEDFTKELDELLNYEDVFYSTNERLL